MVANFALTDPHLRPILDRLHNSSEAQAPGLIAFRVLRLILEKLGLSSWLSADDFQSFMRDKYVALERDKSQFCYLIVRAIKAKTVVEVGSSFGVSTIYLAAGVRDNGHDERGVVIATENEPTKIAKAKENWEEAKLTKWIKLLEGDVMETLRDIHLDDPIDLVLMDIWAPMALPSLKILISKMKKGAIVVTDQTSRSKSMYRDYLEFIHDERNHFQTLTMPFSGGLELSVYLPE